TFASLSAKDFFLEGQNLKKFLMKKDVVYKN
ncbi:GNAT family N-acetyltransferase, partial [Campylobacter coli]